MKKQCVARVVASERHLDKVSLRSVTGRGIHDVLTDAGFQPGDIVVIYTEKAVHEDVG